MGRSVCRNCTRTDVCLARYYAYTIGEIARHIIQEGVGLMSFDSSRLIQESIFLSTIDEPLLDP